MITKVEVRKSTNGEVLVLPLLNSDNGFRVVNIEGLEPVQTTLVSSSFANVDGEYHQSSRRVPRNLRFTLALQVGHPTLGVDDIRHNLFKWFAQKVPLTFRFFTSTLAIGTVEIVGRVESIEGPVFSREPTLVISAICHSPSFYDVTETIAGGFTYASGFSQEVFFYGGTAETGFAFVMEADYDLDDMSLSLTGSDGVARGMTLSGLGLLAGDILVIGTESGKKEITRIRPSDGLSETSLLYTMEPGSSWVELQPGTNLLGVGTLTGVNSFTLQYRPKYGGL